MIKNICIFEDEPVKYLTPLIELSPMFDCVIGYDTILDKIKRYFDDTNLTLSCRQHLSSLVKTKHKDASINQINTSTGCLFINARVIMTEALASTLKNCDDTAQYLWVQQGQVIAIYVTEDLLAYMAKTLSQLPNNRNLITYLRTKTKTQELENIDVINHPWDVITHNKKWLHNDFAYHNKKGVIKGRLNSFTAIYNEDNVFIDKHTIIEDFVVVNAENGPIYIEENVHIQAGTRLEGPLFIGKNTHILGGKISNSTISHTCKISGEINNCVINAYSNKAHYGYLGDSYLGEWVNLGAGTTTSNLKNTYGKISMSILGHPHPTELQFIGAIIGSHVKTGINTSLSAGTYIGFGSNIVGKSLHAKDIRPFTWGSHGEYTTYQLDKFLIVLERVKKRRNQSVTKDEIDIINLIYNYNHMTTVDSPTE